MNQWNEVMDGWMDGWMGGWVNEWMDGRATWLCWATSSLSDLSLAHLFSQLLLWTTSALSCLPPTSFVACATQLFSLHSCCNGFGNLQLQSCLPGATQQQWCFAAHSRAGASHQINQCSRSAYNGDDSALLRRARLLAIFITNRALATVLCAFCRPHLPKVPRMWQSFSSKSAPNVTIFQHFQVQIELSLRRVHFLLTTFPDRAPKPETETLLRDPGSHITRKNHRVWHPRAFSPVNSHVPGLSLSSTAPTRKWWWHDVDMMMTRLPLDIRP